MRALVRLLSHVGLALVLSACGGDDARTSSSTGPGGGEPGTGGGSSYECPPGELLVEGGCLPAGLPDDWGPPGPAAEPTPGVPPDGCGDGFLHDGLGGCEAIVPATACTGAEMAVPGDTACRPIADCGTGTWGDIPVDASTLYVDASFGGAADGSAAAPYPTVQAAVDAAPDGATIAVAAGSYVEDVLVDGKGVAIWGRCPELVEIVGVTEPGAVTLYDAPGAELHAVAVTGPRAGVLAIDSPGALLSRLWVHDLLEPGVAALGAPPDVTLSDSLVVDTGIYGVVSQGALAVRDSEIRGTTASTTMQGMAAYPSPSVMASPSLTVEGCHVHHADVIAVVTLSATVTIARTLIADTTPQPDDDRGWAILASDQEGPPTLMNVSQTVMTRNADSNVRIFGSRVTFDAVTIEDGVPAGDGYASGVSVENGIASTSTAGEAIITRSTLRDLVGLAVNAFQGSIEADEILVQRVAASSETGRGAGIYVGWEYANANGPSALVLERSIVEQTVRESIVVLGSDATIRDSVLRDVAVANDSEIAVGLSVGRDVASPSTPSDVLLERSVVASVAGIGVFDIGSHVALRDSVVSNHDVVAVEGVSGLGLFVADPEEVSATTMTVSGCLIEDNASRGIVAMASDLTVEDTLVRRTGAENPSEVGDGRGIEVQGGTATIRSSEIADVSSAGIAIASAEAALAAVHVHDVDGDDTGREGYGLAVISPFDLIATVTAEGSRVERASTAGILADRAWVEVEGTLVADITSDGADRFGRGIGGQRAEGWLSVVHCQVERVAEDGIYLFDGAGEIIDSTVRDVRAADDDGLFGDGIVTQAASALVRGCAIGDVARAALSSFGSEVTLADNDLRCNDLPLSSESVNGIPSVLVDAGGNLCGCQEPVTCKAVSAGLAPPEPLPPIEEGAGL